LNIAARLRRNESAVKKKAPAADDSVGGLGARSGLRLDCFDASGIGIKSSEPVLAAAPD
jgi:hypothetical protein